MDSTYQGSCRCGSPEFSLSGGFGPVLNCHCAFCRKVHGAAFTTVAFVPRSAVAWVRGEQQASIYLTPQGNRRYFCGECASPLFNAGGGGELAAIVISSLPDDAQPAPWAHVNTESKALWQPISDGLPEYPSWPYADALRALAEKHECTRPPSQLLIPAP